MTKYNILVTGCGGDIGQSVGKILKELQIVSKLIGTDINKAHAGIFIYDECFILPNCEDHDYLLSLKEIIRANNIDILIPLFLHVSYAS